MPTPNLHNMYEGRFDAWQLNESVDDFLQRLPPVTTDSSIGPWIWVANPYPDSQDQPPPADVENDFIPHGQHLLQQSLEERARIRNANSTKPTGTVTRLLNREAESLKQRLADLAERANILSGKWMLFPNENDLERVWKMVVEATITNRLGSAAKVATNEGSGSDRLICCYTKNFRDTEDVLRVLKELDVLGLVKPGKGIYYKSDAYTYLNIYGGNAGEYGLQASAYSSQKMLASANFSRS